MPMRRLLLGLAVMLLAGCGSGQSGPLTVGAAADAQSLVLAHLYAGALRGTGVPAHVQTTDDPLALLDSGAATVVPGFTGRLLAVFDPGAGARSDQQVYRVLAGALPEGIAAGDYAMAAADKPALAVSNATATTWGAHLGDAVKHCGDLVPGVAPGAQPVPVIGSCRLRKARQFRDAGALFAALRAKQINVAWTSTAAPDVPGDAVLLSDAPPALVRAENVVPLYRRNQLTELQLLAVNQVAGVLDTAALTEMRRRVAGGADPRAVADDFLAEHPLGR